MPDHSEMTAWLVDLDGYARNSALVGISEEEHARSARMRPHLRVRYLAARHALRSILAQALNRSFDRVALATDVFGKPFLNDQAVHFNASHSAHLLLVGISAAPSIGVDIELVRDMPDANRLAAVCFTRRERRAWRRARTDRAFLRCWTRKEACLKAFGVGLSAEPSIVDAGCSAEMRLVNVAFGEERGSVQVRSLDDAPAYVAAIALSDPDDAARLRNQVSR